MYVKCTKYTNYISLSNTEISFYRTVLLNGDNSSMPLFALGGFHIWCPHSRGGHGQEDEGNIGCVNVTVTVGVKKSENFVDVIYGRPLTLYLSSAQVREMVEGMMPNSRRIWTKCGERKWRPSWTTCGTDVMRTNKHCNIFFSYQHIKSCFDNVSSIRKNEEKGQIYGYWKIPIFLLTLESTCDFSWKRCQLFGERYLENTIYPRNRNCIWLRFSLPMPLWRSAQCQCQPPYQCSPNSSIHHINVTLFLVRRSLYTFTGWSIAESENFSSFL